MLIGVPPLLGPELLFTLRSMGHGDEIALVDGNYPAQEHARRLVRADGLGILSLAEAILAVMPVDRDLPPGIWRAALNNRPGEVAPFHTALDTLASRIAGVMPEPLAGEALYPRIRAAHTIVATTEPALFANVILRKGVIAPGA